MSLLNHTSTLTSLREQQDLHPLTILSLAEPIITATQTSPSKRKSNVSDSANSDLTDPTPATLLSDLTHYKELFSKLRFSYLEQVTKEKYLRSIVGDPPLLVSHADNLALEEKLSVVKAELKAKKEDVGSLVGEMEEMARVLASRWEDVQQRMALLEDLPGKVQGLEETVSILREQLAEREGVGLMSEDPRMCVGLEETEKLLAEQRERARQLDRQAAAVQKALPAKMRECEVVEGELESLERRKNDVTAAAMEARRIKEADGRDELEEKGRWFKSAEVVLRGVVGVDA